VFRVLCRFSRTSHSDIAAPRKNNADGTQLCVGPGTIVVTAAAKKTSGYKTPKQCSAKPGLRDDLAVERVIVPPRDYLDPSPRPSASLHLRAAAWIESDQRRELSLNKEAAEHE